VLSRSKHWLSPPYWPFGYWGNTEKVLRETPPSCINLPAKSFPFSEKVFMPPSPWGKVASLIFPRGYGQYGWDGTRERGREGGGSLERRCLLITDDADVVEISSVLIRFPYSCGEEAQALWPRPDPQVNNDLSISVRNP
jgi:hypothetical protein